MYQKFIKNIPKFIENVPKCIEYINIPKYIKVKICPGNVSKMHRNVSQPYWKCIDAYSEPSNDTYFSELKSSMSNAGSRWKKKNKNC